MLYISILPHVSKKLLFLLLVDLVTQQVRYLGLLCLNPFKLLLQDFDGVLKGLHSPWPRGAHRSEDMVG